MKRRMNYLFYICLSSMLFSIASAGHAQIEESYEEGSLVIEEREPFTEPSIDLKIGEKVVFAIPVYETKDFGGYNVIVANAQMTNHLDQAVRATYLISFYDAEDQMVGCLNGWLDLEAGGESRLASGIIYATPDRVAEVSKYRLRTLVLEK